MFRPQWLKPVHLRLAAGCAIALLLLRLHPAFRHRTHYVLQKQNTSVTISDFGHRTATAENQVQYVTVPELAPNPEHEPDQDNF